MLKHIYYLTRVLTDTLTIQGDGQSGHDDHMKKGIKIQYCSVHVIFTRQRYSALNQNNKLVCPLVISKF